MWSALSHDLLLLECSPAVQNACTSLEKHDLSLPCLTNLVVQGFVACLQHSTLLLPKSLCKILAGSGYFVIRLPCRIPRLLIAEADAHVFDSLQYISCMLKQINVKSTSMQASMHANKQSTGIQLACIKPNLCSTPLCSINQLSVFSLHVGFTKLTTRPNNRSASTTAGNVTVLCAPAYNVAHGQ